MSTVDCWPEAERKVKLARLINECDGVLVNVAHRLGVSRVSIYKYCKMYDLWPVINKVREARLRRELDERNKKYRGGTWV